MKEFTKYISLEEVEQALNVGEYAKDIKNYLPNLNDYIIESYNFVACSQSDKASSIKLFININNNEDAFNKFVDSEYRCIDEFNIKEVAREFLNTCIFDSLYSNSYNVLVYACLHYLIDSKDNLIIDSELDNKIEFGFIPSTIYKYITTACKGIDIATSKMQDLFNIVQDAITRQEKETSKA